MPHERPDIFASRGVQKPRETLIYEQPLPQNGAGLQQQDRHQRVAQHSSVLERMHTTPLQKKLPYQVRGPASVPWSPPLIVAAAQNDRTLPARKVYEPQHQHETPLQRRRPGDFTSATSRPLVDMRNESADVHSPLQEITQDTGQNGERDCEQSYFVGCRPLQPTPPETSRQASLHQLSLHPNMQKHPGVSDLLPAQISRQQGSVSRPSSHGFSRYLRHKPLPVPRPIPKIQPPIGDDWGLLLGPQVARPPHHELHYVAQVLPIDPVRTPTSPIPPASEYPRGRGPPGLLQLTHVRKLSLSKMNSLLLHGGLQPAELDVEYGGEQQHEEFVNLENLSQPPVLPDLAVVCTTPLPQGLPRPIATWYEFYVRARTWNFEDMTQAYEELAKRAGSAADRSDSNSWSRS